MDVEEFTTMLLRVLPDEMFPASAGSREDIADEYAEALWGQYQHIKWLADYRKRHPK